MSPKTIDLPWSGYFAIGPDGKYRDSYYAEPYKHEIPDTPNISLDEIVSVFGHAPIKPFKFFLVEMAAHVRDNGPCPVLYCTEAPKWLESTGKIKAVAIKKDDPLMCDIIYEITSSGIDFLKEHEAPKSWL
jgi:hypothetical protein